MKMVVVTIGEKSFVVWYVFRGGNDLYISSILDATMNNCLSWFTMAEVETAIQNAGVNLTPWQEPKKENWFKKFWRENFSVKSF